jgi:hypothetical protein
VRRICGKDSLSERENSQARDFPEVARVAGRNGEAALQSTGTNQKIVERDGHASCRRLRTDPTNQFRCNICDRKDRHGRFQFIEERAAALATFRCIRAVNAMGKFRDTDGTQSGFTFARGPGDPSEEPGDIETLAFGFNGDTGIEYYSQDGGFHG